ncbi:hypothetical protein FOB64_004067 [Candida albicans]|uniref:Uncharacterized protein n=1 Tax=Candida albicans TaxID=5476 RepID=A0A8H6BYE6_CANAX|nr:hypothetical protein FOB64_004067 [Candida albicans]
MSESDTSEVDISLSQQSPTQSPQVSQDTKPKKKSVGFAAAPEEDLKEHHKVLKQKEEIKLKSSPFHKIPAELAYLEKRNSKIDPKPIIDKNANHNPVPNSRFRLKDLPDLSKLKFFDVKNISVQNKETELQFHYTTINLPPSSDSVIVDIKFGGLNALDYAKINQYVLNLSNVKVGMGYEFSGLSPTLVHPTSRRGSLSSSQLIYPNRDVLIKVDEETLNKLHQVDININTAGVGKDFQIEEDEQSSTTPKKIAKTSCITSRKNSEPHSTLPPLAKLCSFPLLYNHSKQLLQHLNPKNTEANILINGADINLGLTLLQILDFKIISFDLFNDGLYFPGEKIPVNFKKPNFFASEVINALLVPLRHNGDVGEQQKIDEKNINDYKLDMIIDLIGCKKYFQTTSTKINEIEEINLPFKQNISTSLGKLFNGNVKEPFLTRILKPKNYFPRGILNPWSSSWTSNLLNNWTNYNYHQETGLSFKQQWCQQALDLVLDDKLKFKIDGLTEWKNFKKKDVRVDDAKYILQVEDF